MSAPFLPVPLAIATAEPSLRFASDLARLTNCELPKESAAGRFSADMIEAQCVNKKDSKRSGWAKKCGCEGISLGVAGNVVEVMLTRKLGMAASATVQMNFPPQTHLTLFGTSATLCHPIDEAGPRTRPPQCSIVRLYQLHFHDQQLQLTGPSLYAFAYRSVKRLSS